MNLLDPVLRTSNSAVVLATIKVFLQLTKNLPDIQPQLYERLKNPVLTLLASGSPEVVFCVLKHTDLLVFKCGGIFDADYKQFYVKFDEPLHVKYLKIDLLAQLSNSQNMHDILEELSVYVSEVDQELSRRSIRAIGKVGFKLPEGQEHSAVDKLVELLDLDGMCYILKKNKKKKKNGITVCLFV
jgi:vesicle coat complex subunit